jgi:hypothetical protein
MATPADEKAAFVQRLARDINCLTDPDRFKRKRALDTLSRELFEGRGVSDTNRPRGLILPLQPTPQTSEDAHLAHGSLARWWRGV